MNYLYIAVFIIGLHLLVEWLARRLVTEYLLKAQELLDAGQGTDGCTTPLKTFIHRWLSKSRLLCAAHDFGGLDLIVNTKPGWHNNLITWLAHISQTNPVYWIWGTIVALFTLPWVVWRRNLGIKSLKILGFHVILLTLVLVSILIYTEGVG